MDEEPNSENTFDGIYAFDEDNLLKVSYESQVQIVSMMNYDVQRQLARLLLLLPKNIEA